MVVVVVVVVVIVVFGWEGVGVGWGWGAQTAAVKRSKASHWARVAPAEQLSLGAVGITHNQRPIGDALPRVARRLGEAVVRVRVEDQHAARNALGAAQRNEPIQPVVVGDTVLVGLDVAQVTHSPFAILRTRVPRVERVEYHTVAAAVRLDAQTVARVRSQPGNGAVDEHAGIMLIEVHRA